MANIILQGVYEQKSRQFRTEGQGLNRFDNDFLDAVNSVINAINYGADLASRISLAQTKEDEIALSDEYLRQFSKLLTIELIEMGQRPGTGEDVKFTDLARQTNALVNQIAVDIRNQAQEADTTDVVSFAQLGPLGP